MTMFRSIDDLAEASMVISKYDPLNSEYDVHVTAPVKDASQE